MNKGKRYSSVAEMLNALSDDTELKDEFDEQVRRRQAVKTLTVLRASREISQEEIAKKMGCSQSRISKLENGEDSELRLGDIDEYLSALGLDCRLLLTGKNDTAIDQLKYHVFSIKGLLDELTNLCRADDGSAEAIARAHFETLYNVVRVIAQSAEKLPLHPDLHQPLFRVDIGPIMVRERGTPDLTDESEPALQ